MDYRIRALKIGWLARRLTRRRGRLGRARHIFSNTIYLDLGKDMLVITRKKRSSPISINVSDEECPPFSSLVRPWETARTDGSELRVGALEIKGLESTETYRPPRLEERLMGIKVLEREVKLASWMISVLYSANPSNFILPETMELRKFIKEVAIPLAYGKRVLRSLDSFKILLGLGEGFTPAGDDFISGFISVINLFHKSLSIRKMRLRRRMLFGSTSWASAMLLNYVQRGLLDEDLYSLLLYLARGERVGFEDSLLKLVGRGHTSGLDIALGVTVAAASIHDRVFSRTLLNEVISEILIN